MRDLPSLTLHCWGPALVMRMPSGASALFSAANTSPCGARWWCSAARADHISLLGGQRPRVRDLTPLLPPELRVTSPMGDTLTMSVRPSLTTTSPVSSSTEHLCMQQRPEAGHACMTWVTMSMVTAHV